MKKARGEIIQKYATFLWQMVRKPQRGILYVQAHFAHRKDIVNPHHQRVGEYHIYQCTLEAAVAQAAHTELAAVQAVLSDSALAGFYSKVKASADRSLNSIPANFDASPCLAQISYCICHLLRPTLVVETGVARGVTSAFILRALAENGKGHLYSIDLPTLHRKAESFTGTAIPEELKGRWTLRLGDSQHMLPRLLQQIGAIDMFIHDSRHTYQHQMMEYTIVWPYLQSGGVLISDDVYNDAFIEFSEAQESQPLVVAQPGGTGWYGLLAKL